MLSANTKQDLNKKESIYTSFKLIMVLVVVFLLVSFVIVSFSLFIYYYVSVPIGTVSDSSGNIYIENKAQHDWYVKNATIWFYLWIILSKTLVGTALLVVTITIPQKINPYGNLLALAISSYFFSVLVPLKWMKDFYNNIKPPQKPQDIVFKIKLNNKDGVIVDDTSQSARSTQNIEKALQKLDSLKERGLIDDEDYQRIRSDIAGLK